MLTLAPTLNPTPNPNILNQTLTIKPSPILTLIPNPNLSPNTNLTLAQSEPKL